MRLYHVVPIATLFINVCNLNGQSFILFNLSKYYRIFDFGFEELAFTNQVDSIVWKQATHNNLGSGYSLGLQYSFKYRDWVFGAGIDYYRSPVTSNMSVFPDYRRISNFQYTNLPITLSLGYLIHLERSHYGWQIGMSVRPKSKVVNDIEEYYEANNQTNFNRRVNIDNFNLGITSCLYFDFEIYKPIYIFLEAGIQIHELSYDYSNLTIAETNGVSYLDKLSYRSKHTTYKKQLVLSTSPDPNLENEELRKFYSINSFFLSIGFKFKLNNRI